MENNNLLLEKYKRKISFYFALSILIALWIIQTIFSFYIFYAWNQDIKQKLINKYSWVENIIKNKDAYSNNSDLTTRLLLEKTLDSVTIYKNDEIVLWSLDKKYFNDDTIQNSRNFKYFVKNLKYENDNYLIIIKENNPLSYINFIKDNLLFFIFTIPFIFFFYLIWYKFVNKNFRPVSDIIASMESFSENINHELRTPLAEIISTLNLSLKNKEYESAINQSLKSTKKLDKILNSILWIINTVNFDFKKEKIDINAEIEDIIRENENKIKEKNLTIIKKIKNNNNFLFINKEHFYICVSNIFKNSIKYSNKQSKIIISYKKGEIEIIDNGIWINEENLNNIFNRYFRENYSNQEWYWLWLSLVKKISDINKWNLEIKSEKDKWTKVKIIF